MKYPKIETVYNRSTEDFGVLPGQFRKEEFALINKWLITEKIDGRNHRVMLFPDGTVEHRGRTDKAQFANFMTEACERLVDEDRLRQVIKEGDDGWPMTILYGELFGPKIQGGGKYRDDISLSLFDVRVGDWWLNWNNVTDIALSLGLGTIPVLANEDFIPTCSAELFDLFGDYRCSLVAKNLGVTPEGIVARTDPLLFDRQGNRIMWKLKAKDFRGDLAW